MDFKQKFKASQSEEVAKPAKQSDVAPHLTATLKEASPQGVSGMVDWGKSGG